MRAGVAAAFNKAGIVKKENPAGRAGHNFHRCFTEGEKEKMAENILFGQMFQDAPVAVKIIFD